MRETLNRLCSYAEDKGQNLLIMMDQITEKTRAERLPNMYGHIFARAGEHQEMKLLVEPPMHVDSVLSSNIQFADWIAAAVSRAIEYQLLEYPPCDWIADELGSTMNGAITHKSKLHLTPRAFGDFHNFDIFKKVRPMYRSQMGNTLQASHATIMAKIYAKSQSN